MAAHVTHEVRNPLNSIRLNVELLEEDLADASPASKHVVSSILREVDRLTDITEQYLKLVRLPEPKREPVELAELAGELVQFLKAEMALAHVSIELVADGAPRIYADADQLRQALLNLCRNAREAMSEGGRVRIQVSPAPGGATLSVSDQGTGIPEADREKVFDLFYTTKEHGTGLGLSLTQEIVSAHRGNIRCEASDWGGTRFSMWLPTGKDDGTPADHVIQAS
jgi:signal transduction histidine kinase